jgi:hypothetical protein
MYNKAQAMAEEDRKKAGGVGGTAGSIWKGQQKSAAMGAAAQKIGAGGGATAGGAVGGTVGGAADKLAPGAEMILKALKTLFIGA